MFRLSTLLLLLAIFSAPTVAGTVYKCGGAHGQVTYQDAPCARSRRQQSLHSPDDSAMRPPPARVPIAADSHPSAVGETPIPSSPPGMRLPQLYRCTHAVDGSTYISHNGHPPPFRAPLGMLGALPTSLVQTYGQPGGAGISAPEANRGRVTSALVANNYVWVQDPCRPLSVPEVCRELRDEQEQNACQLQRAFKSERPPLQQRDDELQAQLTNC